MTRVGAPAARTHKACAHVTSCENFPTRRIPSVGRVLPVFPHLAGPCVRLRPRDTRVAARSRAWAPWDSRTGQWEQTPFPPRLDMGNAESTGDRSRDLYNAAKRGDVEGVRTLHAQGAGLEWRDAKVRACPHARVAVRDSQAACG
jgi:hypothetical protein